MPPETIHSPSSGEPVVQMLTVKEAAAQARVAKATVYAAIATGQLACYRIRSRPGTRGAIRISRDGQLLAEHPRLSGTGQRRREPAHYQPALAERPRARLVLEREQLCALGPEVTAYITVISQRRRRVLADELAACTSLLTTQGADGLRQAAAACVTRGTCGAEYLLLFAGTEPALSLPDVPTQPEVERDLALYEVFVGR